MAAAAVVPRLPDDGQRHYSLMFSADVVIFFNGLLIGTYGFLAAVPGESATVAVVAVLISSFTGVAMLLDSIGTLGLRWPS